MKLCDLIAELHKLESLADIDVGILFPYGKHVVKTGDFVIEQSKYTNNLIYLRYVHLPEVDYQEQECMVGGHDTGCMCNLGFTPRWRNK